MKRSFSSRRIGTALCSISACVLSAMYAVHLTMKRMESVLIPAIARSHKQPQYIYLPEAVEMNMLSEPLRHRPMSWEDDGEWSFFTYWINRRVRGIAWRLLEMASETKLSSEKIRLIKKLTGLPLEDSDIQHLAQLCDSETAAVLAREPNVDTRFFLSPAKRKESFDKTALLDKFYKLFSELKDKNDHWCLRYFVSRTFRNSLLNYWLKDLEYLAFECVISPVQISDDNVVTLCVESLMHHIMIKDNLHDMIAAGGLETLYDAYHSNLDSFELKLLAAKILMKVSSEPQYLRDIHVTGWMKILVEWSNECDQRLSSPAASALANLDISSKYTSCYKSEVCLLYPLQRPNSAPKVDLIIVHGLLGSAHFTWKQREAASSFHFQLSGPINNQKNMTMEEYTMLCSTVLNDLPKSILENADDCTEDDFEFVLADIPVSESEETSGTDCYTISGNDPRIKENYQICCPKSQSQCWPKDWIPKDVQNIRILGVDYSSRLTNWTNWCPFSNNEENTQLSEKAQVMLQQLVDCGIGQRPIVWVGHSMGGLVIKHIINIANDRNDEEYQQLVENSKSVIFLGTPHFGSPLASIRKFLAPLLPSIETKELEFNSPELLKLHEGFSKIVREFSINILTFVETKATKLSVPPLELEFNCVAPTPSDVGTGQIYEIPVVHVEISKLGSRLSFIYFKVLEAILNNVNACQ